MKPPESCRNRLSVPIIVLLSLAGLFPVHAADRSVQLRRARQLAERRQALLDDFAADAEQLARKYAGQAPHAADEIRNIAAALMTASDGPAPSVPPAVVTPPLPPDLPPVERHWREQMRHLRDECAADLYRLARSALRADLYSLAFSLIGDVLRMNPDHELARRIKGFRRFEDPERRDDPSYAGEWVSAFEAQMRGGREPHVLHEQFGWIPKKDVARWEQGLRPWKRTWVSAEKEALLRRDFRNAWEIRSEHFLVRTNVSREAGVEVSSRLEAFYDWLTGSFPAFFESPAALRQRFEKAHVRRRSGPRSEPMKVMYFATREEYERRTRGYVPPGIETYGLYWQPDSTAYFFYNPDDPDMDTICHEATHQILDLHTRRARVTAARALARQRRRPSEEWILGRQSEFWIIEGLACYLESFRIVDGQVTVGDPTHVRIEAARVRLLRDQFYVPLETFCRLGKDAFQQHPQRSRLYSQASGVTHFLMHYDQGRYRDALVTLLSSVYQPDARRPLHQPSLAEITGVSFAELDRQYREHILHLETRAAASAEKAFAPADK